MSVKVEKLEGNYALLTIECTPEEFEKEVENAYRESKGRIQLPGFRKGHAPRAMIEKIYGQGVFYEDAANRLINSAYYKAMEDEAVKALEVVSRPDIDIVELGKDKPFIFTAKVAVKPAVELGQYKGFDIEKKVAEVSEEDVDAEVKRVQETNSRMITIEDRPAEMGDIATVDYEGFMDGKAFEGGKGENYELELGSHSFIDTFEDQIAGHAIGDEFEVNVKFPEEYHAEDLAGKPALFKVRLNGLKKKELPVADDEFASEVSEFETIAEYREDLKKNLLKKKQEGIDAARKDEILEKAVENAKMDVPKEMIELEMDTMVRDYEDRLKAQGLSLEMYEKFTGQTAAQLRESYRDRALDTIKKRLVLEAIAGVENVEVTDDDVTKEIERMAAAYQMEPDQIRSFLPESEIENMKKSLAIQKAMDKIAE